LEEAVKGRESAALIFRDFERNYPLIEHGEGIYLFDIDGKRYIDGSSGSCAVTNIGHGVREVIEAVQANIREYAYCPSHCFANRRALELAELLASIAPQGLNQVWLVSDGSEATETAVKFARQFHVVRGKPLKSLVISRWLSYHGATLGALGYGGHPFRRGLFLPLCQNMPHIPPAYCYRCDFDLTYSACDLQCAWALEKEIRRQGPENVAAFIAEPVVGAALGAVPPVDEYFAIIREICDRHDVIFIADEVMTGFGRTGEMFGMGNWGVKPDIMACAKGVSGGYLPLGAVIMDERIIHTMKDAGQNVISGHTYCAHHLMAAAASAVVQYIIRNGLVGRSRENGAYFIEQLKALKAHEIVGDVRGIGLFAGLEFVKDKEAKEPFAAQKQVANRIGTKALTRGLITYPGTGNLDGVKGDHILMAPPLIIERDQIDEIVAILDASISDVENELL
jgi:adenosylmethionine-8-amino-7-oxononanoate aminotransferase